MPGLTSTVLFGAPQTEITSTLVDRIARSNSTSIVTGFATPGGLSAISAPIEANPSKLTTLVIGAATYRAFEALDNLLTFGVTADRLYMHLGHTSETGGKKNPFARFHPMLHSKVYYMEMPGGDACAFIGSHNVTSFALTGLNGEAAVLLEGPATSTEFAKVRQHIEAARDQAVPYSSSMKQAYAWWTREFLDGLKAEVGVPQEWSAVRTILLFASAGPHDRPKTGDHLYFELPSGIEQIESLKTETHLFLFETLPSTPSQALELALEGEAYYTCITLGAENKQGNKEVVAQWRIDGASQPTLTRVPGGTHRPMTASGMQQVRAEIKEPFVAPLEYAFERDGGAWEPKFASDQLSLPEDKFRPVTLKEAKGGYDRIRHWKLVKGLVPRRSGVEKDQAALRLASPESGSFVLVSIRQRRREPKTHD